MFYSGILQFQKFLRDPFNSDISFNTNDTFLKWALMCNYTDTIPGVLLINLIIYFVNQYFDYFKSYSEYEDYGLAIYWSLRVVEILTIIFDGMELSGYFQGLMAHLDGFNFGLFCAKWLKIIGELINFGFFTTASEYMKSIL